jgi:hypothetical protein
MQDPVKANDVNRFVKGEITKVAESIRVLKLVDSWYVQTTTSCDGPFETYDEAEAFLHLSETVEAARIEFAGLAVTG